MEADEIPPRVVRSSQSAVERRVAITRCHW
jgi:hypothetical protein